MAVTANAGTNTSVAYGLPHTFNLDGSASSSTSGSIVEYQWFLIGRPPGSSAALSNPAIVNPTLAGDVPGTYAAFLRVRDSANNWSAREPWSAPAGAIVYLTIRTQNMNRALPAPGQRGYASWLLSVLLDLDTQVGLLTAHLANTAGRHLDSQITYTRSDGSKKNIGAGDDDLRKAIDALDDATGALGGLHTSVATNIVNAINQGLQEGQGILPVLNGQTVTVGDIVEMATGARQKKAVGGSRHPLGIALEGGTGNAGGTVATRFQDRGIVALIVENGAATVLGQRVVVAATTNQIEDAGMDTMTGTLGIALESVTGDGVLTCKVYLQPLGGQ